MSDPSHGYEALAHVFLRSRDKIIGQAVVRAWAGEFMPRAQVLELGCGHGVISEVLIEAGLELFVVDASPSLLSAFRERFPNVEAECNAAEHSSFFGRTFDGAIAWGLLFLLPEDAQRAILTRVAGVLRPGGRLLFTAPRETFPWTDIMTGQPSRSLGTAVYEDLLHELGLEVSSGVTDEGDNHYFFAARPVLAP